jgi:hypothetical protein
MSHRTTRRVVPSPCPLVVLAAVLAATLLGESARSQDPPSTTGDLRRELEELRRRLAAIEAREAEERRASGLLDAPGLATTPGVAPPGEFAPVRPAFAWGDFRWMPGNHGPAASVLRSGAFTGEVRADTAYHWSMANPADNTIVGSSEVFRHSELQVTQLGVGGDFWYRGAHARVMTQFGMYSQTTPRNDASSSRGQWQLDDAYRYVAEAYAGWHWDALHGVNLQAGIFMSYIGLWSYYNFDNWTYQPSYVSSNTPWFFEGVRLQVFATDRLKIEPWLVNGWQAYGEFVDAPGAGLQVRWTPDESVSFVSNDYVGKDTLGRDRLRLHSDNSLMVRYWHAPRGFLSKAAASVTLDAGCETGEGVSWDEQYFLGGMVYNRFWFLEDRFALTIGGGAIENPGRYLVLVPPVNGATAASGTPYFTADPGDGFHAWDAQLALDYMPTDNVTFRFEYVYRHANVPYFAGRGGVTPPGGNTGAPGSQVAGFEPDLDEDESRFTLAMMVRF